MHGHIRDAWVGGAGTGDEVDEGVGAVLVPRGGGAVGVGAVVVPVSWGVLRGDRNVGRCYGTPTIIARTSMS